MLLSRRDFLRASALAAGAVLTAEAVGTTAMAGASQLSARTILERASSFEIHPSVGIARVGNSPDAFYFGPEVPGGVPRPTAGFKDASGAMAKQAARFRIFAIGSRGEVLGEVPPDVHVDWTVTVANKKAAWYESSVAMDITVAQPVSRRNASVTGAARDALAAAVTQSVGGRGSSPVALSGPTVFDNPINFGEILTDGSGRLVFLPGDGRGYPAPGASITTFADNDGWTDNICDGPVQAVLTIGGRRIRAHGAWVLVTPPNYGPAIAGGPVTLLDEIRSPLVLAGLIPASPVTFHGDILPLLQRLVDQQWVNKGFFSLTRAGQQMDWLSPANLAALASSSARTRPYRSRVTRLFRNPAYETSTVEEQPLFYGDGITIPPKNQLTWLPVTTLQFAAPKSWARGDFDPGTPPPTVTSAEQLALSARPRSLDEAALASVLGGANHPGVEAPWVLRVPSLWATPYRLRVAGTSMVVQDYGDQLTPAVTMGPDGPVQGVTPGDLSMWMGVPWHADAASCRNGYRVAGYNPDVSPYLPAFWPARVPNEVLAESDYETVVDTSQSMATRQQAFARRRTWIRPLAPIPVLTQQLTEFVSIWPTLGVVAARPGPSDGRFPRVLKVETGVSYPAPTPTSATTYVCGSGGKATCPIDW